MNETEQVINKLITWVKATVEPVYNSHPWDQQNSCYTGLYANL